MSTAQRETVLPLFDGHIEQGRHTRYSATEQLQRMLGETEHTALLLDYLEDTWETIDLLKETVGRDTTLALIFCGFDQERSAYPVSLFDEGEDPHEACRDTNRTTTHHLTGDHETRG